LWDTVDFLKGLEAGIERAELGARNARQRTSSAGGAGSNSGVAGIMRLKWLSGAN
jgi:hypothetical protein